MWHESLFVSDCAEDFLCVSIADKPDIEASTYCLEPRVAVEMNAIRELPFFRSVNKLVLLPGELSEPCPPIFAGLSCHRIENRLLHRCYR